MERNIKKAILVIDMPKDCEECQFKYQKGIDENWCSAMPGGFIGFTTNIPEWCPLKPVFEGDDGSLHPAETNIRQGETYYDYFCRITTPREIALRGLSLKIMSLRSREMNGWFVDESRKKELLSELHRLSTMTDEEYDLERFK